MAATIGSLLLLPLSHSLPLIALSHVSRRGCECGAVAASHVSVQLRSSCKLGSVRHV
jgi:hypothetical protein